MSTDKQGFARRMAKRALAGALAIAAAVGVHVPMPEMDEPAPNRAGRRTGRPVARGMSATYGRHLVWPQTPGHDPRTYVDHGERARLRRKRRAERKAWRSFSWAPAWAFGGAK